MSSEKKNKNRIFLYLLPLKNQKKMNGSSKLIHHKKEMRIAVYFEKNTQLIERIKQFEGAKWNQTLKVWHLPDNQNNRVHFKIPKAHLSFPSED